MSGIPEPEGLQPERTALAWHRTALVSTLSAVAIMAVGMQVQDWASVTVAGLAAIAGAVLTGVVRRRVAALRRHEIAEPQWPPLVAVCVTITLTATAATLLAVRIAAR